MGREARCRCDWAGEVFEVKALLEAGELILRGGLRKRVPLSSLRGVAVEADRLCFEVSGEAFQLFLGADAAQKWAKAIATPPPSLAHKLGITNSTNVRVVGEILDDALQAAIDEAAAISVKNPDLIVICTDTMTALNAALRACETQIAGGTPLWVVFEKGPGHALNETAIRSLLREKGLMDNKVASVSARYTALRFRVRQSG